MSSGDSLPGTVLVPPPWCVWILPRRSPHWSPAKCSHPQTYRAISSRIVALCFEALLAATYHHWVRTSFFRTMTCNSVVVVTHSYDYWICAHHSSSVILNRTWHFGNCFPFCLQVKRRRSINTLGMLESTNSATIVMNTGKFLLPHLSHEGGNRWCLWNFNFNLEYQTTGMPRHQVILSLICHCWNPLDSIYIKVRTVAITVTWDLSHFFYMFRDFIHIAVM